MKLNQFIVYNYIPFFFFCLSIISCNSNKNKEAIARVYDKYLYVDDVRDIIPKNATSKDSAEIMKSYIQGWIEKNIVLTKAENNLTDEQKNVEQQLEDYRISLITYLYENALINQKLDTIVSQAEIEKYYTANSKDFELKDNIIKVWYIKIKKQLPVISRIKNLYKTNSEKNKIQLQELCT